MSSISTVGITGGTGFLGVNLVDFLINKNIQVHVFTRKAPKDPIERAVYHVTDYRVDELTSLFNNLDAIVHLAFQREKANSLEAYFPSIRCTNNVFNACSKKNVKNVIFASSISVYGSRNQLPWSENQILYPQSYYGIAKYSCELLAQKLSADNQLKIKSLRFAHIFGANEKNNYLINLMTRKAINNERISIHAPAKEKREFLYIKDAVLAIWKSLNSSDICGPINIGSNESLTNYEVANIISDTYGYDNPVEIEDRNALEGIDSSFMINSLASELIGYNPRYTMKEAFKEIKVEMDKLENVPIFY